jgi:hypothetical protein
MKSIFSYYISNQYINGYDIMKYSDNNDYLVAHLYKYNDSWKVCECRRLIEKERQDLYMYIETIKKEDAD